MPRIVYKNKHGKRVPSVTTIGKQWGINTQPLLYWAHKQGMRGVDLYEKTEAEVGTLAHAFCESWLKTGDIKSVSINGYEINQVGQATKCFENFKRWAKSVKLQVVETELSLVSEEHQFGGTLDIVAFIDNELAIVDIKTGKDIYEDNIIQVETYRHLWNENFPETPTKSFHLIRTGKEMAMFSHSYYTEFPGAWNVFLHLRSLYDLHKQIKKLK